MTLTLVISTVAESLTLPLKIAWAVPCGVVAGTALVALNLKTGGYGKDNRNRKAVTDILGATSMAPLAIAAASPTVESVLLYAFLIGVSWPALLRFIRSNPAPIIRVLLAQLERVPGRQASGEPDENEAVDPSKDLLIPKKAAKADVDRGSKQQIKTTDGSNAS